MRNVRSLPSYQTYDEIRWNREREYKQAADNIKRLNDAHDRWMTETISLAVEKVEREQGRVPAPFTFVVMGSAGRREQAIWSDQDHGLIFMGSNMMYKEYFLRLGEEIREGMAAVGYPRCEGKVMASHPRWCHSAGEWKEQIDDWIQKDEWATLRHLLTFIDARALLGERMLLNRVKSYVFQQIAGNPCLLGRLAENTSRLQQATNAFGKLLTEEKGPYTGFLHIKDVGLFPYIHAMRLLAMKEGIHETSTLERMKQTAAQYPFVHAKIQPFYTLLNLRASFWEHHRTYEDVHYIPVRTLSKDRKKRIKTALQQGKQLFQQTKKVIESGEK
ncbi:CBS domain-containing protein [Alteribacillus persepolensis]|uniref:CBS domain-containing protein n=1 Tax=Alteribacillus persepolensis TaxID=568899 RepID=A0A1G8G6K4_9BACI|nr:DUF294 nucleotidyltransferase-like domain-containing protein [Alteribacillus persepolensis]SDH90038.1 CBS domain-containing protein [Alteribacillus persepolensis]